MNDLTDNQLTYLKTLGRLTNALIPIVPGKVLVDLGFAKKSESGSKGRGYMSLAITEEGRKRLKS